MTVFQFLLVVLATIGAHRIFNYEALFYPVRTTLQRWMPWNTLLHCAACNAFWFGLLFLSISLWCHPTTARVILGTFAIYPVVRACVWIYAHAHLVEAAFRPGTVRTPLADAPRQLAPPTPTPTPSGGIAAPEAPIATLVPPPPCRTCQSKEKSDAIRKEQERYLAYEKRIVIMTTFADWNPSYSLTSVVLDHARMLAGNERWLIQIWVNTTCSLDNLPPLPKNVEIKKVLPPIALTADKVDQKAKDLFVGQVLPHMLVLGNATIIAHDLLFVSSYVTIAAAIHDILGAVKAFTWFHVCHSAPSVVRPTNEDVRYRTTLPPGHRLICLAASQVPALAAYYEIDPSRVSVVPNARDLRVLAGVSPRIADFIRDHNICTADVVQVFPLSTPRACDKGLSHVIRIFAELSKTAQVRLIVANAHANSNEASIISFHREAKAAGLPADALVFTSEAFPDLAVYGLPSADLQALFQFSNVFIFPTVSEACSLTLMEAALAGNLLVLNGSVPSLLDIVPKEYCITYDWGNLVERPLIPSPLAIAKSILSELDMNRANLSKRAVLRTHNLDTLGTKLRSIVAV